MEEMFLEGSSRKNLSPCDEIELPLPSLAFTFILISVGCIIGKIQTEDTKLSIIGDKRKSD